MQRLLAFFFAAAPVDTRMEPVGPRRPGAGSLAVHSHPARAAYSRINGAKVFGARPGSEFLFAIPASGDRPMTFAAEGLPKGLSLDPRPASSRAASSVRAPTSSNSPHATHSGEATRELRIVIGERIALTPPMGWNSWNCWARDVTQEQSPLLGSCDGRVGTREPRLDVHQHRRRLAGPARRPLQRHPDQRQVPRHEGALGAGTRHGT